MDVHEKPDASTLNEEGEKRPCWNHWVMIFRGCWEHERLLDPFEPHPRKRKMGN
jgi:hypothetical protein